MPDLELAVVPRAAADRVGPYDAGVLRVRVTRPPADGEANRAILKLVARALEVAPGRVTLVAGSRARRKRLRIDGIDDAELDQRLRRLGSD
jgi:uncharacterized protein (TIGR00251 family)